MTKLLRRTSTGVAAMLLGLAGMLLPAGPADASPWSVCGERDTGSTLCFFNYNPPESWPSGFAAGGPAYMGRCYSANNAFFGPNNTTSYIVNHSIYQFFLYDRSDCTGPAINIWPRDQFAMPSGWNDRISSVMQCDPNSDSCYIQTVSPTDATK